MTNPAGRLPATLAGPVTSTGSAPAMPAAGWEVLRSFVAQFAVAQFVLAGEPISKARARFTKQFSKVRTYTPEKTKEGERLVAEAFKSAYPNWRVDGDGAYGVLLHFHAETFQRRDVDNLTKLVLDACNGIVWDDDAQVAEVHARVERGVSSARTEVLIYSAHPSGLPPSSLCEGCGKRFRLYRSWTARRFCSTKCSQDAQRRPPSICAGCGKKFRIGPYTSPRQYCTPTCRQRHATVCALTCVECTQPFKSWSSQEPTVAACSPECRRRYWAKNPIREAKGRCDYCGGPTSRKEYSRCRPCRAGDGTGAKRSPSSPQDPRSITRTGQRTATRVHPGTVQDIDRKRRAFNFIVMSVRAGGNPTNNDIAEHLGIAALGLVRPIIDDLEAGGHLTRGKTKPYRFTILKPLPPR